ncbi:MAG: ATP synthase subunit I [Muribaculaceae bacterium]|nr:ATP synthase subunit I [Muribaculaceae bacterium]
MDCFAENQAEKGTKTFMAKGFLSEMIRRELKFLVPRALIFDGIVYIISLPVYGLCGEVPLGLLAGTAVMLLNFIILGLSSERAVEKTLSMAKGYMFGSYMIRLLITGLLFYAGVTFPQIHLLAAAVPQLYPKLAYTLNAASLKRKGG